MATASVLLDIRANTNRALGDFKKFSAQLDNKFLVSGLKLDVVRSALSQINREFQRSIGEQGLQAGESLRAAQNQAALLTQTFKGFSATASLDMAEQFSSAFSQIAVTAGGTAKDIQKALAATPFISTNLSEDLRKQLGEGILSFQRDFRRAGLSDDIGGVIRQFLAGQVTAGELIESGEAGKSFIGSQLAQLSRGNINLITNAEQRSRVALELVSDPQFNKRLQEMAKRAYGFRGIIEDLNTYLFNPEAGIFGSLRQVTMGVRDKTTVLDETNKLVESVFGRQGLFVNFFKQIGKIFGIEDPLKIVITGVRFITRQIDALNRFIQSEQIQGIVKKLQEVFTTAKNFVTGLYDQVVRDLEDPNSYIGQIKGIGVSVGDFFKSIYDTIKGGEWDPTKISTSIKEVGESVRGFIRKLGEDFRALDLGKQTAFLTEVLGTLISEVAKTLGAVVSEGIKTLFSGKGVALLAGALEIIRKGLTGFFTEIFGGGMGSILGAIGTVGIAAAFGKKIFAGIMGFAGMLVSALPGAKMIQSIFGKLTGRLRDAADGAIDRNSRASRLRNFLTGRDAEGNIRERDLEGGRGGFQAQMLALVRRIATCVCGPGGLGSGRGRDIDIDADTPEARRERARTRRGPTGPSMPRRAPLTSLDTANPYAYSRGAYLPEPDTRASYLRARRESRRNYVRGLGSSRYFDLYTESLGGVSGPFAGESADERALRASRSLEGPDDIRYQERLRQRYNRRFSRRARIGRGIRGFGKGALIAGGVAALGGLMLGGGDAQAAEIDPMTGEPVPQQMGAGQALGNIGMGAAEGALAGAMFGPWGAAIGGVLGAGVALMDKGTRDAAGKWVSGIMGSMGKFAQDFIGGTGKFISGIIDSLGKAGQRVIKFFVEDLPSIWLKGMKTLYIDIPSSLLNFGKELGKSMLDSVSNFNLGDILRNTWESIKNFTTRNNNPDRGNYEGLNYFGPAMRQEARMSGAKPLLVNDREFVIPRDGFPILADTIERRISSRGRGEGDINMSPTFNIAINVNGNMAPGDVESLRTPVLRIIEEAWASATQGTVSRGAVV